MPMSPNRVWPCYLSDFIFPSLILFQLLWPLCLLDHSRHAPKGLCICDFFCLECFSLDILPPSFISILKWGDHPWPVYLKLHTPLIPSLILPYLNFSYNTYFQLTNHIFMNLFMSIVFLPPLKHKLHLAKGVITAIYPKSRIVPGT